MNLSKYGSERDFDFQMLSFKELCLRCELSAETLDEMLDYGLIEPAAMRISDHAAYFQRESVLRVYKAMRLCRDLELNIAGAALAIELLEENKHLRAQILTLLEHENIDD